MLKKIFLILCLLYMSGCYAADIHKYQIYYPKHYDVLNGHQEAAYGFSNFSVTYRDHNTKRVYTIGLPVHINGYHKVEYIPTNTTTIYMKEVK